MNLPTNKSNMIAIAPPPNTSPLATIRNPLLSSSLPRQRLTSNTRRRIRNHHHHTSTKNKPSLLSKSLSSTTSIPLPSSHIRRTPSELQLADDMRRAEYEDVRMYARLVVGMQSQCVVNGGYVHPLTKKSLQDILRTKEADMDESDDELQENQQLEDDDQWELSFAEQDEEQEQQEETCGSVDSPLPCQPMATNAKAPTVVKTPSAGSIISLERADESDLQGNNDEDDECFFSLEL